MAEVEWSQHSLDRLEQRGINAEDVKSALARPSRELPGTPGSLWVWGYDTHGEILKVCIAADRSGTIITAVYPD